MPDQKPFPFLHLPPEIRDKIYEYLLLPLPNTEDIALGALLYFDDDYVFANPASFGTSSPHTLSFRHSSPKAHRTQHLRKTYKIRSGRLRSACEDAQFKCETVPRELDSTILGVNWQVHDEAARLLYGSCIFDFDTHIEACVPFLSALTPFSRSCLRRINIIKRALPYEKDFDRCEWSHMCRYLSQNLSLTQLDLGVVAGKPALGWEGVRTFSKDDFELLLIMDEMTWVKDLLAIKGLKKLNVKACEEHCPPPSSQSMGFYVAVSASVESGLAPYLSERLLVRAA